MITEPTPASQDLGLVALALHLVSRRAPDIPHSLQRYLRDVLVEAATLASRPETLGPRSTPEAISLAVELAKASALMSDVESLRAFDQITPEIANRLLDEMERANARP